ncbi:phage tail fiber protein [Gilliamella mensalis]|uniref:phage tail fiber protein n=1 Tax=Gilliamella mensalis TaxID=1908520 RepID=UPI001FC936F3|nr:prophage tail fiber N-terminal domain-containing protein [Gilliamella mensalis]
MENTYIQTDLNNGHYELNLLPCDYDVYLLMNNCAKNQLGTVQIFADSKDGTLNDFLLRPHESEITPDILKQIMDARDQAVKAAENVGESALKIGDYGIGGQVGATVEDFSAHLLGGFYQARTPQFPDLPIEGDSIASLLVYPSSSFKWKVEQLTVVQGKIPRIFVRTDAKNNGKQSWFEVITAANSIVDANGFLKAASPILRLFGSDSVTDEQGFTKSGCGLVNDLAAGVTATRIDVGHYEIHGSLGFAKTGWYIQLPEGANGNKKIFAEYSVDENNVITVKTFTRKFNAKSCEIVAGEPIDITDGRWIDIRLEMPVLTTDNI